MNPCLIGGAVVAVLLPAGTLGWAWSRRKPARIEDAEDVATAVETALPGFMVAGAVIGADGAGALAVSDDGRVAVARRARQRIAVREVAWQRVRATPAGVEIETGDRRFGRMLVSGVDALDIRRLAPQMSRG